MQAGVAERRGPLLQIGAAGVTLASHPEDHDVRDPNALIDTAALAASLGDPSLRVFDCTTCQSRRQGGMTVFAIHATVRSGNDGG